MISIKFKDVSKTFKIYQNKSYSIKEIFINFLLRKNKLEIHKYPVLTDVSFDIKQGETVGIIGQNGTGKSTTLKLITKILYPDKGDIETKGNISSLLEIGAGFQPDMTGRENVYLYGSILGIPKKEIELKYNSIVEFSEVEQFMDTAVKNYSSGMYMRLAFSVAIHVDPEILVIDEVLAVGDAGFQKKCIKKIEEFKDNGKTIVFVSHDMNAIKMICDRVFFIKKGGEMIEGSVDDMVNLYNEIGNM
jgi:ABC-2 type transport system ATP-binding protein